MDTQPMTIRLPEDVYEQLRREAFETRDAMNVIIVEATKAHLATRKLPSGQPTQNEWRLAFDALARLVRDEYPAERTLTYIVETWGSAGPEDVEAVRIAAEFTAGTGSGSS